MRIGAVLLALVISAHGGQTEPVLDLATERVTFSDALRTFRGGDDSALASLEASAERMANLKREDARDIVSFYRSLTTEDRRAGLQAEERYEALWAEVRAAEGADTTVWPPRRNEILSELEAIIESHHNAPDPTPAARALSLAALLEEQRARQDDKLTSEERATHLSRSEERARQALTIFESAGLLTPTLEPMWLLARVDDARGRIVVAREGFEDCLDLAERVANESFRVRSLRGLLRLAEAEGDRIEQRSLLREMAGIPALGEDWKFTRSWASYLLQGDEGDAALTYLDSHIPKKPEFQSQWHFLYGSALQRVGRVEEAEDHFRQVRLDKPLAEASTIACAELRSRIWRAQAELRRHNARAALELVVDSNADACSSLVRSHRAYTLGAAHLELGHFALAEAALREAIALGKSVESRLEQTEGDSVFGEVIGLETVALLANAVAQQGRALEAVRVAEEAQARVLRDRDAVEVSEDDLLSWAAHYERGILTWIVGADTTVCAHISSDGTAVAATIPLGREMLHDAVRRTREAAIAGEEARARLLAGQIQDRMLPGSLHSRIGGSGTLLVLAHGPLERFPFDLLPLAEESAVAVLPGLAESVPGVASPAASLKEWSVLGDPTSEAGFRVLPGARQEIEAIGVMVNAKPLAGEAFDHAALMSALNSGRALHIATHLVHGCSSQEAIEDAALLLARGARMCAREIREAAPRLPLAVLAACETGQGEFIDAQALTSMSNAFLGSGTRNLCITLWPVEDGAARRWSEAFHRSLASGTKPSEAVLAARESLRRTGTPVSEWAAFRFAGRD